METLERETVSVAGAARILGVHANTVRSWSDQGRLDFLRINARGDRRYPVASLRAFLADAGQRSSDDGGAGTAAEAAPPLRADGSELEAGAARMLTRIGANLDPDIVLRDLLDQTMSLFAADRGGVFLVDGGGLSVPRVSRGLSDAYLAAVHSSPRSSLGTRAVEAGRPLASADYLSEPLDADLRATVRREGFTSVAAAPLVADGAPLGLLILYHDRRRPYDSHDLDVLGRIAESASASIRNARAYARMATWAAQLRSIQQLGVRLSRLRTVREIGLAIATELRLLIDCHNVRVYRLVGQGDLVAVAMRGQVGAYTDETPEQLSTRMGEGLTGWVAQHRIALLVPDATSDPRTRIIPGTDAIDESMLLAPMLYEDAVLGVLVLSKLGLRQFSEDDLRLLEIYASFAAQAMANADTTERLREQYAQMARWAAQLRSIQQLGVRLSRLTSVREIGLAIATELRQLIDYHNVRVHRLMPDGNLAAVATRGQVGEYIDETAEQLQIRVGEGLTGWVAEHRQAQLIDDAANDPRAMTIPGTERDLDESMLLAPLLYEDEVLGVLSLSKLGLRQFSRDDLRLLEIYASFAAQAMANADVAERLRGQSAALERQLRSQQVLLQVTESMLNTLDPRRVLDQIAQSLGALVRYDYLAIAERDEVSDVLHTLLAMGAHADAYGRSWLPGEEGLVAWVAANNEAQLVDDVRTDARVPAVPGIGPLDGSMIAVPLRRRDGVKGVITLERQGGRDRFSGEEFELVKLFAAQVSIAMQNAEEHRAVEIRAETDALTGLRNKGTFDRQLVKAVGLGEPFSLLMLDLDDFKGFNDARGHQAGDELLRRIAAALRAGVRESDVVFRYGGDEFALLLPGTDAQGALAVAQKAREAVHRASAAGSARVSCSIGVAAFPEDGADQPSILLAADRACYASKRSGRDRMSTAADGLSLAGEFTLTTPTPVDQPSEAAESSGADDSDLPGAALVHEMAGA